MNNEQKLKQLKKWSNTLSNPDEEREREVMQLKHLLSEEKKLSGGLKVRVAKLEAENRDFKSRIN
jgi:hypothetical protein